MELAKILRPITKEKAVESYKELQSLDCTKSEKQSRIGTQMLDYFFLKHRLKAKTRRHISFFDAVKDKDLMSYIDTKIVKIKGLSISSLTKEEHLKQRYSVFQLYYGSINQYRPTEAKKLYCKLKPKIGILDFSAGWGGRCLAAMASEIPYTGIDANINLETSYKDMIALCSPVKDTKIIFKPSEEVDFSKIKYDLVFTSPPYFMIEEYEKMPQYGSKEGFIEKFFKPVVQSAWKYLHSPGYMALNMPKEMYDSVKKDLPTLWKRMYLPVASRHPTNAVHGRKIGSEDAPNREEVIYIWKKGGRKTRKNK